jgi:hypothetical protein
MDDVDEDRRLAKKEKREVSKEATAYSTAGR